MLEPVEALPSLRSVPRCLSVYVEAQEAVQYANIPIKNI